MFEQPKLNARQARWMSTLSEFDFEIKYIKGKENKVVDALSRRIKMTHVATISSYRMDLRENVKIAGKNDEKYQ